ncbi:MAG: hypothetical protein OCU22_03445 [Canidatus Methanoxibalbensis ujae]|nr:hypothetical protein [Candidatus Methanoxibalbensis ujae]
MSVLSVDVDVDVGVGVDVDVDVGNCTYLNNKIAVTHRIGFSSQMSPRMLKGS